MRTQLMCSSSQGDQPFNITWLKDNNQINSNSINININEYSQFSSILTIHNVSSQHNGNYTCQIRNRAGIVDYMAVLSVAGLYNNSMLLTNLSNYRHLTQITHIFMCTMLMKEVLISLLCLHCKCLNHNE